MAYQFNHLGDARKYTAPGHTGTVHTMHLQHESLGSNAPFWVGCSYYLPGAQAEWGSTPLDKIYIGLQGKLTVRLENETVQLGPMDSIWIGPNEARELLNETNEVATILVVLPYPPAR